MNMNSIEGSTLLTMQRPKNSPKKGRHDIKKSPQQTQAEKEGMGQKQNIASEERKTMQTA